MMKKIIVLLVFLMTINSYGLDLLSSEMSLELGWLPQGTLVMYELREAYDLSNTFYAVSSNRVNLFEYFFIGGSINISMHWAGQTFAVQGNDYMFETGIQIGILELFYKHNCIHPSPCWMYFRKITPIWEVAHDRIGIKISGKIGR